MSTKLLWFGADAPKNGTWTKRWATKFLPLLDAFPGSGVFLDCPTRVPGSGSPKTAPEDMTNWGDFANIEPGPCAMFVIYSGSVRRYDPWKFRENTQPFVEVCSRSPAMDRAWLLDASDDLDPTIERGTFAWPPFLAGRINGCDFGIETVPTPDMLDTWRMFDPLSYGLHGRYGDAHKSGVARHTITELGTNNCLVSLREPDVISDPLLQSLLAGITSPTDPSDKTALATWRAQCAAATIGAGIRTVVSASNMTSEDLAIIAETWQGIGA